LVSLDEEFLKNDILLEVYIEFLAIFTKPLKGILSGELFFESKLLSISTKGSSLLIISFFFE